jgi:hypothetical protein
MPDHFTTRQVGELYGVDEWRVRRLFEDGTFVEPPKFGGKRMIGRELLPSILDALRHRGWVDPAETAIAQ